MLVLLVGSRFICGAVDLAGNLVGTTDIINISTSELSVFPLPNLPWTTPIDLISVATHVESSENNTLRPQQTLISLVNTNRDFYLTDISGLRPLYNTENSISVCTSQLLLINQFKTAISAIYNNLNLMKES